MGIGSRNPLIFELGRLTGDGTPQVAELLGMKRSANLRAGRSSGNGIFQVAELKLR
jgi:hypothetical protein